MLNSNFNTIGLIIRPHSSIHKSTIEHIRDVLLEHGKLLVHYLDDEEFVPQCPAVSAQQIGQEADLVVSVGGDGTLLNACRLMVDFDLPLVGINLGRLGFLADVTVKDLSNSLHDVFNGNYSMEQRSLLQGDVLRHDQNPSSHTAFNDVILQTHESISMIEFEVYSDNQLINRQRADGLIVTTPTGSTAYSLSGGGPIMHPSLQAVALVPICPHTLSHRPIVLPAETQIEIRLSPGMKAQLSFDGLSRILIDDQDRILIRQYDKSITLLHPAGYNYFHILREKLNWSNHP